MDVAGYSPGTSLPGKVVIGRECEVFSCDIGWHSLPLIDNADTP